MDREEALNMASDFLNCLRKDDKSYIEKYTKTQIKCALSLVSSSDSKHQWYKEMERRIAVLDEEEQNRKESPMASTKFASFDTESIWCDIKNDYRETKRALGRKINFVKDDFKRIIIFRDIEQAYILSKLGFNKPAVILAGGVIEELLRIFLETKGETTKNKKFEALIIICEEKGFLKEEISNLASAIRRFRNSVHLAAEKSKKDTISKATASATVALIFTIINDFQK